MALQLYLEGNQLTPEEWSGGEQFSISKRRSDENGNITTDLSSEITFSGLVYNLIKNQLFLNANGSTVRLKADVYDDCCNAFIFTGYIAYDSIKLCFDDACEIKANLRELTPDSEALACLQSTYVWDNTFAFQQQPHPNVLYCGELRPNWLMDFFIIVGLFLKFIEIQLFPFILVISIIIIVVNVISNFVGAGDAIPDQNGDGIFDWWKNLMKQTDNWASGCYRRHPAPRVRSYIDNVCRKCGIQWESTILKQQSIQGNESWDTVTLAIGAYNPYYNALWFYAPVQHGGETYTNWIDDNKPLQTGEAFLIDVCKCFNANFKLVNGILKIERKDFFLQNTLWLDLSDPAHADVEVLELCMDNGTEKQPAWIEYTLATDGLDWCGNEAKGRSNETVNYRFPFAAYPNLVGKKEIQLPISGVRFRTDGIDRDVLDQWEPFFQSIGLNIIKTEFDFSPLLPLDLCSNPKMLIPIQYFDNENVKITKFEDPLNPGKFIYNNDVTFSWTGNIGDDSLPAKPYYNGNLYDRFFYIEDPRLHKMLNKHYTAKISRNCELLATLDFSKYILLPPSFAQGVHATIEEVVITETEIQISGKY